MFNLKFFCLTSLISLAYVAELHAACSTATLKGVYRYTSKGTVQGRQYHGSGRFLFNGNGGAWHEGSKVYQDAEEKINTSGPFRYKLNSNCTGRDWVPDGRADQLRVYSNRNISAFFNDLNERSSGKVNGKRIGNLTLADARKIKNGLANWNRFASNNNQQNESSNGDNISVSNQASVPEDIRHIVEMYAADYSGDECIRTNDYQACQRYQNALSGLDSICYQYNYQRACDAATAMATHHAVMIAIGN